jgi:cytochrome c oxidase subunit 4
MVDSNNSHRVKIIKTTPHQNDEYSATEIPADGHQAHPLKVYFVVWGWLFILSACSYAIDFMGVQGYLRWTLILFFMLVKAGLIVAIFMHIIWERLSLTYAILLPPMAVLVFVAIMAIESNYTVLTRFIFFDGG